MAVDVARRPVAEGEERYVLPVGAIVPALEPRAGVVRNLGMGRHVLVLARGVGGS